MWPSTARNSSRISISWDRSVGIEHGMCAEAIRGGVDGGFMLKWVLRSFSERTSRRCWLLVTKSSSHIVLSILSVLFSKKRKRRNCLQEIVIPAECFMHDAHWNQQILRPLRRLTLGSCLMLSCVSLMLAISLHRLTCVMKIDSVKLDNSRVLWLGLKGGSRR